MYHAILNHPASEILALPESGNMEQFAPIPEKRTLSLHLHSFDHKTFSSFNGCNMEQSDSK